MGTPTDFDYLDKKLAKAFYKKVEWSYNPYSDTPSKVFTIETQDLAKAEIVVVGTQDSPKFIIEKHSKQRYVSLGGSAAVMYSGYYVSYVEWDAYASGGQVKTFPANFEHGSHSAVAGYWAGIKAAGDAQGLAIGLEFTLTVIPFGSTALEVNDHGVTPKAGVMFVTDLATTIIPVAKAGLVAGKISVKTSEAVVKTAKAAGYAAGTLQAGWAVNDARSKGVNWQNSADLIDAMMILASVRVSGIDAVKLSNKGKKAAEMTATPLKEVKSEVLEAAADNAQRVIAFPKIPLIQNSCFVHGTLVLVPGGFKNIEEFRIGDAILSRPDDDPNSGVRVSTVEHVFRLSAPILRLGIGGQVIGTTAEHPFFVSGKGWTKGSDLAIGDVLIGEDKYGTEVESIEFTGKTESVINLRVEPDSTYFVGGDGWDFSVWVHNTYTARAAANGRFEIVDEFGNFAKETYETLADAQKAAKQFTARKAALEAGFAPISGLGSLSQAGKFGIKSYNDLRKLTAGTGLQAHHLLEQRFAGVLGTSPGSMSSIAMTQAEHQFFTKAWRQLIPYGQGTANATREQIMNAARIIYKDYPDILKALGL